MIIGGLQKFSLLDYPEHLSAIVFTTGCNFRCQYCYNPMLVWPNEVGKVENITSPESEEVVEKGHPQISENDLFDFLKKRVKKLDAVVITGGEPTLHSDLVEFIEKIRALGFKIKLDTNGTNPQMVNSLLEKNLLDYIAMDIKSSMEKYDLVTGVQPDLNEIQKSIKIIMESGVPYEFRTTMVPDLVDKEDIEKIGEIIKGAPKWYLQQFKQDVELVNSAFQGHAAYSDEELEEMVKIAQKYVEISAVR